MISSLHLGDEKRPHNEGIPPLSPSPAHTAQDHPQPVQTPSLSGWNVQAVGSPQTCALQVGPASQVFILLGKEKTQSDGS